MAEFPKKIWLIGTDTVGLDAVWCDCPDPAPGIDEQGVIGPYVLGADEEITRLRQRVAELDAAITVVLEQQPYMATRVAEMCRILRKTRMEK